MLGAAPNDLCERRRRALRRRETVWEIEERWGLKVSLESRVRPRYVAEGASTSSWS